MFTSTLSLEISTSFYVIGIIIGVIMVFTKTLTIVESLQKYKEKEYKYNSQTLSLLCF